MNFYRCSKVLLVLSVIAASPAYADDVVRLSSLLGVPSGDSATASHPPFFAVQSIPIYGIGANTPGNWTSIGIQFSDTQVLAHGIGQHPSQFGESRVEFSIAAVERATGRRVVGFTARVGIEVVTSAQNNGAVFDVRLDGVAAASVGVSGRQSPSVPITIAINGARTLTLATRHTGQFNSNHACWGLAEFVLGEAACPADFTGDGFADGFDYDAFVACYESGCDIGGLGADFNNDGFVDGFDYDDFVSAFEDGCR